MLLVLYIDPRSKVEITEFDSGALKAETAEAHVILLGTMTGWGSGKTFRVPKR